MPFCARARKRWPHGLPVARPPGAAAASRSAPAPDRGDQRTHFVRRVCPAPVPDGVRGSMLAEDAGLCIDGTVRYFCFCSPHKCQLYYVP